jgi:hypothetical protein
MNWQGQTKAKSDFYRERTRKSTTKASAMDQSRHRAERVAIIHEMAIEEARSTEVSITRAERGRYGNAHIRYNINGGLVDVILEVTPMEELRAERAREQKERSKRGTAKETEHEIKEKYRPRRDEDA